MRINAVAAVAALAAPFCMCIASCQNTSRATTPAPTTTLITGSNQSNPLAPLGNFIDRLSATTTSTQQPKESLEEGLLKLLAPDGVNVGAAIAGLPTISKFVSNITGSKGGTSLSPALTSSILKVLSSRAGKAGAGASTGAPARNPTVKVIENVVQDLCLLKTPISQFVDTFVSLITMNPAVSLCSFTRTNLAAIM